ncbi:MAG: tetratricopeptide repeat protein [Geminicoccaceae bacterium]
MIGGRISRRIDRRPIGIACILLIAFAIALLLGRWLAIAQAPLTRDAVARNLLENGSPDKAAHVFETPIWQGVALYRAGHYHRSVGAFVTDDSVTGLYNMGNAYARLGLYRGAITAYEAVLKRRPDHEDAHFNLELVRAAAKREQELEDESRETENAGNWEDGLRESRERGEPETTQGDQAGDGEHADAADPPEGDPGDQDGESAAGETAAPESQIAGQNAGGSDREGEQADASIFSLAGRDDQEAGDLAPDGNAPEDSEILGGVTDRAQEEAMADEILLRRIEDDPAIVLKARLNMALRRQKAGR